MYVAGEAEESIEMEELSRSCRQRRGGERVGGEDVGREGQEDMASNGGHHQWNVSHCSRHCLPVFITNLSQGP